MSNKCVKSDRVMPAVKLPHCRNPGGGGAHKGRAMSLVELGPDSRWGHVVEIVVRVDLAQIHQLLLEESPGL